MLERKGLPAKELGKPCHSNLVRYLKKLLDLNTLGWRKEGPHGCRASQNCRKCKDLFIESSCFSHSSFKNLFPNALGFLLQSRNPREGLHILPSYSGAQGCLNSHLTGACVTGAGGLVLGWRRWLCPYASSPSHGDSADHSCCDLFLSTCSGDGLA